MIKPCFICQDEALRYCVKCLRYFCPEHLCEHLASQEYTYDSSEANAISGASWLSNDSVIATFSEAKLREALARYEGLIITIKMELARRAGAPTAKAVKRNNATRSVTIHDIVTAAKRLNKPKASPFDLVEFIKFATEKLKIKNRKGETKNGKKEETALDTDAGR